LLKVACIWPGRDSHAQRESYESDILPLDHLHLQRHMSVNNLPRVATRQCAGRESNQRPLDHKSNALPLHIPSHPMMTVYMASRGFAPYPNWCSARRLCWGTSVPQTPSQRVDGICGSGQIGTVKNGGVENAGVNISARYGKGGHCGNGQCGIIVARVDNAAGKTCPTSKLA